LKRVKRLRCVVGERGGDEVAGGRRGVEVGEAEEVRANCASIASKARSRDREVQRRQRRWRDLKERIRDRRKGMRLVRLSLMPSRYVVVEATSGARLLVEGDRPLHQLADRREVALVESLREGRDGSLTTV
jgi:hypothetical protein